jgi:predicted nucleic acid-binding protein
VRTDSKICADASLLVKLALPEVGSDDARTLWESWLYTNVEVFAPRLVMYEFVSAVRQAIRRQKFSTHEADAAIDRLLALELTLFDSDDLHKTAYSLANELDVASAYDAHHLALAMMMDCEFWTADSRLYNSVSDRFPLIRLLGA